MAAKGQLGLYSALWVNIPQESEHCGVLKGKQGVREYHVETADCVHGESRMEMTEDITGSPMVPFVLKPHFIQRIYIYLFIYIYIYLYPLSHASTLTHTHAHTRAHTHKVFDRPSVFLVKIVGSQCLKPKKGFYAAVHVPHG